MKEQKEAIKVIELCAGIGQTSIALKKACDEFNIPMELKAFAEIDKNAIEAYRLLHGDIPNLGDITKASFEGMSCDILLNTSPCTSISSAGKQEGFEQGTCTASSIIWETKRIIKELESKPKLIFFENVKAMVSNKFKSVFDEFVNSLEAEGYTVRYKVLDAQDFGVPQHRERVYIMATLEDVEFEFPYEERFTLRLKDVLDSYVDEKYFKIPREYFIDHSLNSNYTFRVHNPSFANVAHTITTKAGSRLEDNFVFEHDVASLDEVRFKDSFIDKNGLDINNLKASRIRKLTRHEVMRLMGMSDDDMCKLNKFSDCQIYKMMGNGIVIPVVKKIFMAYFESL